MASGWKPFTFYDTFNDTFDSSVQALKNLSSFPTFSTPVPVAAEIEPDQLRARIEDQTQFFSPCGCVLQLRGLRHQISSQLSFTLIRSARKA
jgi:hypothetical protein